MTGPDTFSIVEGNKRVRVNGFTKNLRWPLSVQIKAISVICFQRLGQVSLFFFCQLSRPGLLVLESETMRIMLDPIAAPEL
jgi:hypothetical protein